MKKILLILFISFALIMPAVPAFAAEDEGDGYNWTVKNINDSKVRELKFYDSSAELKANDDGDGRNEYKRVEGGTGPNKIPDFYIKDTAYNGKVYVAVGSDVPPPGMITISLNGAVFLSTDGINWENINIADTVMRDKNDNEYSSFNSPLNGIAWNGEKFVVVGNDVTMYSTDGENWSIISNHMRKMKSDGSKVEFILDKKWELYDIVWDGRKFIAVGREFDSINSIRKGIIICSVDGEEWNVTYTDEDMRKISYNNNVYIASGLHEAFTSRDGENWTKATLPSFPTYGLQRDDDFIWNGKTFILTRDYFFHTSSDLKKWNEIEIYKVGGKLFRDKLFYIDRIENMQYYDGKVFASAIGHDPKMKDSIGIFETTDGLSWAKLYMPIQDYISSLQVTNGNIYAWGYHGEMYVGIPKPDSWAAEEVNSAVAAKLVPASMQKDYRKNITRKDFCELVVNLCEVKTAKSIEALLAEKNMDLTGSIFTDTSEKAIVAANKLGIVNGKGNGKFDPNGSITRAEAAVMLANTAKVLGADLSSTPSKFADGSRISSWAEAQINYVAARGVMGGVGNNKFDPLGTYTRQQAYITMLRLFKKL